MRKRLVVAAFCILALPLLLSPSRNNEPIASAPFGTVAYAGYPIGGQWCQCGCGECFCDPGEQATPCIQSSRTMPDDAGDSFSQDPSLRRADESFDFGATSL